MRKLSKILIPIVFAIAVATPITCLVSCSKSDFAYDKLFPSTPLSLSSNAIDVVPNKVYTVSVDLSKLKKLALPSLYFHYWQILMVYHLNLTKACVKLV